jgi:hypothetical protein
MNVEPLPPETLAALAALHVPLPYRAHIDSLHPTETEKVCAIDFEVWPCQCARLLATVEYYSGFLQRPAAPRSAPSDGT